MTRRRTASILTVIALVVALVPVGTAVAAPDADGIYPIVFPVQGPNYYTDTFGAPRSGGRTHQGQDIMTYGQKGVPVVAAAAGTVFWMSSDCCALAIRHADNWSTWYIHLNNDTQNEDGSWSDDGKGWGIADGVVIGTKVEAGQLIGWVGDSGNAEDTAPHLHFELRSPSNIAFNPYQSLLHAVPYPDMEPPCPIDGDCDTVAFQDSVGKFEIWDEIEWGASKTSFFYGDPGDVVISGDWNCDGIETLGLYRRSTGFVYLRNSNTGGFADLSFYFGQAGDIPVAGNFNGEGCDTLSIYRPSEGKFYISNQPPVDGGAFIADYSFFYGQPGDKPFVGDFDGDGIDTVGLHRESTGFVYFRNSNTFGVADFEFYYGDPGDVLLAGDWDGDGADTVGVYRPSNGMFYVRNSHSTGNADFMMYVGAKSGVVAIRPE